MGAGGLNKWPKKRDVICEWPLMGEGARGEKVNATTEVRSPHPDSES